MKIEIIGAGCPKCKKTEENAKKAVKELGINAKVEHVFDPMEAPKRGIVSTPALLVDGTVKISGKVPDVDEIKKVLIK